MDDNPTQHIANSPGSTAHKPKNSASFSFRNRIERALFRFVWFVAASWTPPPLHNWRCFILRKFGATIGKDVRLYSSAIIWHPANLYISDNVTVGPRVRLYNQGDISIQSDVVISQGAHICASTHRINDPNFELILRPIKIARLTWIAAEAFVGPGVQTGEGSVLGARAVAFENLDPWGVYRGNPAKLIKRRLEVNK